MRDVEDEAMRELSTLVRSLNIKNGLELSVTYDPLKVRLTLFSSERRPSRVVLQETSEKSLDGPATRLFNSMTERLQGLAKIHGWRT